MSFAEWQAARDRPAISDDTLARPTTYGGTQFRSALEANWAATLDRLNITWEYETWLYCGPSGRRYLPDFWLPAIRTFIEVKGAHMERASKPAELAEGVITADVIVLIGFEPRRMTCSPFSWESKLQWRDPAGYDTRLTICPHCSQWQWMRAELSRRCRACHEFHTGLLAKSGEIPFSIAEPDQGRPYDAFAGH